MSKPTASPLPDPRLGFHYFPDTLHYRASDLKTWLPALHSLGASWLVLRSEVGRAIPEHFLRGLKQAHIEPLVQFQLSLAAIPDLKEIGTLLAVYARWGVRSVIFFDRPNARSAWPAAGWVQQDLVERFLDRFLPVANLAVQMGLNPVFPPLEPGGDYWDTAFLRTALEALQRRKQDGILQNLALSVYAWKVAGQSLNWGAGGPESWPQARPYQSAEGSQDQRGFRIFDWYQAITRSVLHEACPVILLQAGLPCAPDGHPSGKPVSEQDALDIARLLAGEKAMDSLAGDRPLEPIQPAVIAGAFYLLSAEPGSPCAGQAWFREDGSRHPAVDAIRTWRHNRRSQPGAPASSPANSGQAWPIQHYLLLPGYEWGVSDWYLEVIRPFVKKYRPTIGFSLDEAEKAARVTVVGNAHNYPEDLLSRLERAGCVVEQVSGDGTQIATQLAER